MTVQDHGAIHYHVLARNVYGLTKRELSSLAVRAGFGFICDVRPVWHAGGACAYLTGYLTKAVHEWVSGRRVWSCSARWRVVWERNYSGRLRGTVLMQPLQGDPWVSVSPWEYDPDESKRLKRLRAVITPTVGRSTSSV